MKYESFKTRIAKEVYNEVMHSTNGNMLVLRARLARIGVTFPHNNEMRKAAANIAYDIVMRWDARCWKTLKELTNRNLSHWKNIEYVDGTWFVTK